MLKKRSLGHSYFESFLWYSLNCLCTDAVVKVLLTFFDDDECILEQDANAARKLVGDSPTISTDRDFSSKHTLQHEQQVSSIPSTDNDSLLCSKVTWVNFSRVIVCRKLHHLLCQDHKRIIILTW